MRRLRPPFKYFGGKVAMAPDIVGLIPPHHTYVESFGGAGAVLFAKRPSEVEVFSDKNERLIQFYKVVQSPDQCEALLHQLALTPYSRLEFTSALENWDDKLDPVESARRWFVRQVQSFSGAGHVSSGWSFSSTCSRSGGSKCVTTWLRCIQRISPTHSRLQKVVLDCCDYSQMIERFDGPSTVFYLDPPYIPGSETAGSATGEYGVVMSLDDHRQMVETLQGIEGGVLLSGYQNPIYTSRLRSWKRLDREVVSQAARSKQLGLPPNAAVAGLRTARRRRVECLWLNPRLVEMWKG